MAQTVLQAERIHLRGDAVDVNSFFLEKGWSDGLPVIPPTEALVERFVAVGGRPASDLIGVIPPRGGEATVEAIAINAVMAGCRPEYMPVLVAAVQAMVNERFQLFGAQTTTHPCAVLLVLNGPVRKRLNVNCGSGVFGPGWQANATIGRAVRLILLNVGGGVPGIGDMATQGQPSKYSYCIGENEEESPWEPFHVERGFRPSESTVSVLVAEAPNNIIERVVTSGAGLLIALANAFRVSTSNNGTFGRGCPTLVLCPEHARLLASAGISKKDVREYIYEHARIPLNEFPPETVQWRRRFMEHRSIPVPADGRLPVCESPENIHIFVAGGPGKHSSKITTPSFQEELVIQRIPEVT